MSNPLKKIKQLSLSHQNYIFNYGWSMWTWDTFTSHPNDEEGLGIITS